jgi:hypothetical protein
MAAKSLQYIVLLKCNYIGSIILKYTGLYILMMAYERLKHVGVSRLFMLHIFCWAGVGFADGSVSHCMK